MVAATAVSPRSSWQSRGHECAERRHEDEQRQGQRQELGLASVLLERLRDRPARAGVAELFYPECGMRGLAACDGGQDGLHALARCLGVSEDVELHQGRAAVR